MKNDWFVMTYDLNGNRLRSALRMRILRAQAKLGLTTLQRSVYALEATVQNEQKIVQFAKFLKEQGANVYLFRGASYEFAGEEGKFDWELGATLDGKYERLKLQVRGEIGHARKLKAGKVNVFIKRFGKLKEKYLVLCGMDRRETMSDARMLADAELKELEKRLDEATVYAVSPEVK